MPALSPYLAWAIWAAAILLDWATTRHAVRRYGVRAERHPLWRRLLMRGGLWFEAGFFTASLLLAIVAWQLLGSWGVLYVAALSLVIAGGGNLLKIARARRRQAARASRGGTGQPKP